MAKKLSDYISESYRRNSAPQAGDEFDFHINETLSIETTVLEHGEDSFVLDMDEDAWNMMLELGVVLEAEGDDEEPVEVDPDADDKRFDDQEPSMDKSEGPEIRDNPVYGKVLGKDGTSALFNTYDEAVVYLDKYDGATLIKTIGNKYMIKMPEWMPATDKKVKEVIMSPNDQPDPADVAVGRFGQDLSKELKSDPSTTTDPKMPHVDDYSPDMFKTKNESVDDILWLAGVKKRENAKTSISEYKEPQFLAEAEYQGRTVKLGKPMKGDVKKYKVYVKDPKTGNVKKVNFGDKKLSIKRDNPGRRKNFRARHNCSQKKDRTTAGYWSCRMWSRKPVSQILKGK
jgi:hypothetical protein